MAHLIRGASQSPPKADPYFNLSILPCYQRGERAEGMCGAPRDPSESVDWRGCGMKARLWFVPGGLGLGLGLLFTIVPAAAQALPGVTATLAPTADPRVAGTATLQATGDRQTRIDIAVRGLPANGEFVAHIHNGSCAGR